MATRCCTLRRAVAVAVLLFSCGRSERDRDAGSSLTTAGFSASEPTNGAVLEDVVQLGVDLGGACVLSTAGEVYCWGGASIDGARDFQWGSAAPLRVAGLSGARAIQRWSAIGADGMMYVWGCICPAYREGEEQDPAFDVESDLERYPNLVYRWKGLGTNHCRCTRRATPSRVEAPRGYWDDEVPCFELADGKVTCMAGAPNWAPNWFHGEAWRIEGIVDVDKWSYIECLLHRRGSVACLVDVTGYFGDEHVLTLVWLDPGFRRPVKHLYAFTYGVCGLLDTGAVECAKVQTTFEDPDAKEPYFGEHFLVPGAHHPRDLNAREQLYIDEHGKLFHYRIDRFALESGEWQYFWRAEPGPPTDPAVEIGDGEGFVCVRTEAGRVQCWGRNEDGQCGIGKPTGEKIATPTYVAAPVDLPTHPFPPLGSPSRPTR